MTDVSTQAQGAQVGANPVNQATAYPRQNQQSEPSLAGALDSAQPLDGGPLETSLASVLKAAPELVASPGLAVGVATSGGNTSVRAQGVARAANAISDSRAKASVDASSGGFGHDVTDALDWFGNHVVSTASNLGHDVVQGAERVGSKAMTLMNAPLRYVQHEYRYLHDVEARHGRLAALLEGIGLAAGGALGTVAAGPWGGVLGSEVAAGLEGQVFYRDSWARTASASYVDPNTHRPVSLGRLFELAIASS